MRHLIVQPSWLIASLFIIAGAHAGVPVSIASDNNAVVGQTVTIDQITGEIRPATASERQQLQESTKAIKKNRQVEPRFASKKGFVAPRTESEAIAGKRRLSNGGTAIQVPESYMSNLTVTSDQRGQLHIQHQDNNHSPAHNDVRANDRMEATHE